MKEEILDLVTEEIGEEFEVFFTKADNNNGTEQEVVSDIPKESAKESRMTDQGAGRGFRKNPTASPLSRLRC